MSFEPRPRFRQGGIFSFSYSYMDSEELKASFHWAVEAGWSEERIDEILDIKNDRDPELTGSFRRPRPIMETGPECIIGRDGPSIGGVRKTYMIPQDVVHKDWPMNGEITPRAAGSADDRDNTSES